MTVFKKFENGRIPKQRQQPLLYLPRVHCAAGARLGLAEQPHRLTHAARGIAPLSPCFQALE